eukprot:345761_1
MSLFDPLYQIEETPTEPPSLTEISKSLNKCDGSGSGLMTARQTYAACQNISNLGFTEQELQEYVKEGLDVAGDGQGRINLSEFAPYLAFEAKKKYKKSQKKAAQPTKNTTEDAYINPFADFASNPSPPKRPATTIMITPDPLSEGQPIEPPVDMKESCSPTESDQNALKLNGAATSAKKKRPKIDAIVVMKRGAAMLKYGRRGFPHFRWFQISHDLTKLLWYSREKGLSETHVTIPDIRDILNGQQTEVFKQCTQKTLEKASFSIIYGPKRKSLDVVAKSSEEAALWIKGLKGLKAANRQGKLHMVVQILVDVDFKDISNIKYPRQCTDDERRKNELQHKSRPELVLTISETLLHSRTIFQSLVRITASNNVQKSNDYENLRTLASEIEERLEEIEFALSNKTADLTDLKRDVWVLKVDVTVLEEKAEVLGNPRNEDEQKAVMCVCGFILIHMESTQQFQSNNVIPEAVKQLIVNFVGHIR